MATDLSYIRRIKDPVLLGNIIDNANKKWFGEGHQKAREVRYEAYDQLWTVLAERNAIPDTLEWDLWIALAAYESILSDKNKRKSYAVKLRQKIKRSSIFQAACGAVLKGGSSYGFKKLLEMDRLDASFERIVLKHRTEFPANVVEMAEKTLKSVGDI